MTLHPEGVPPDWQEFECANPTCPYMVWAPVIRMGGRHSTSVLPVCSPRCAKVLADAIELVVGESDVGN